MSSIAVTSVSISPSGLPRCQIRGAPPSNNRWPLKYPDGSRAWATSDWRAIGRRSAKDQVGNRLQRTQSGHPLCVVEEPTTDLHPADVEKLIIQIMASAKPATVIVVEHHMGCRDRKRLAIDVGRGAGGGRRIVMSGPPRSCHTTRRARQAPWRRFSVAEKVAPSC
jgi:hypothetical protein